METFGRIEKFEILMICVKETPKIPEVLFDKMAIILVWMSSSS